MKELLELLKEGLSDGLVPWQVEMQVAKATGAGFREIEATALRGSLRLERYARNYRTIGIDEQLRLHEGCVAIIGCGGLGGYLIEGLARLGVGTLIAVDPDSFEASNLNRQILATITDLGRPKTQVAEERVRSINPATTVIQRQLRFEAATADLILAGVDVIADALDSIPSRLELAAAAARLGLPLVHGAIAGWYVQATTALPGSGAIEMLFGSATTSRGIETETGNPAFAPAVAASIQAAEITKLLLGKPAGLAGKLLHLDLERMTSLSLPL
ncbi:MAG: HesA/MoeB/ThiF family protein [Spirochaetota bacterium]